MTDEQWIADCVERALVDDLPPGVVCADRPELLAEVTRRLERARGFSNYLDDLFPADVQSDLGRKLTLPVVPGYTIECVLGQGGHGVVYQAHHEGLGRSIALKMIDAEGPADRQDLARLVREARTLANLSHRNIVTVYDVGEVDGQPYFTMELVEGGSLATKIAGHPMPPREAAQLVCTLADAIQTAHQAGIVHRDLKPANILVTSDGTPKVTDFGLARLFVDDAPAGEDDEPSAGTPAYMAPEQIRGGSDAFAQLFDVYALGVILYEVLVGRPPFAGISAIATQGQVLHAAAVPPRQLRSSIPADLNAICLKCIEKAAFERYPSAAHLADDLRRYLNGYPTLARPLGPLRRWRRFACRHPALLTTLTVAGTAAAVVGGMLLQTRETDALRRSAAEDDLREVITAQGASRWVDARSALDRAVARFGNATPTDMQSQLDEARRWIDLADRLDKIHLDRMTAGTLPLHREKASAAYAAAFKGEGLEAGARDEAAVDRLVKSPVRDAICVAVDDWSVSVSSPQQRRWLLKLAQRLDVHADEWTGRIRNAGIWNDPDVLSQLASDVPVRTTTASALLTLADRLRAERGDPRPLLRRVQAAHPSNFFVNLTLSDALLWSNADQAAAFARAALAARPTAAAGFEAVGSALRQQGKPYDAIGYYDQALQIEPNYSRVRNSLGNALKDVGRFEEAIASFRIAQSQDKTLFWSHRDLALVLRMVGPARDALPGLLEANRLRPNQPLMISALTLARLQSGDDEEAKETARRAVDASPDPANYVTLATVLAFLEDDTYFSFRTTMLRRFATTTDADAAQAIAIASLLMPTATEELTVVEKLLDVKAAPRAAEAAAFAERDRFARRLLRVRQNRRIPDSLNFAEADSDNGPGDCLVRALSMAKRLGEARAELAKAVVGYDWRRTRLLRPEVLAWHVLRREAERQFLPSLPDILSGTTLPTDPTEALAMLGAFQTAARFELSADAYQAFFENRTQGMPLRLATYRLAAGAATKAGRPAMALTWLEMGLAAMVQRARDTGIREPRAAIEVAQWKYDQDLVGLRDTAETPGLTPADRKRAEQLWRDVHAFIYDDGKSK
ncbi:MAG: serine/threonine-protein kinase [Tepidisphaeraceae bacterium]